jgi:transposase-like protein
MAHLSVVVLANLPVLGGRWYMDETNVKVAGRWRYVFRAIDQYGGPRLR